MRYSSVGAGLLKVGVQRCPKVGARLSKGPPSGCEVGLEVLETVGRLHQDPDFTGPGRPNMRTPPIWRLGNSQSLAVFLVLKRGSELRVVVRFPAVMGLLHGFQVLWGAFRDCMGRFRSVS